MMTQMFSELRRRFAAALCGLLATAMIAMAAAPENARQTGSEAAPSVRFLAFDVIITPQEAPLAAYQADITFGTGAAKIVGIEGGEHSAFAQPPFYDHKAMQHDRVVIAAFSTNALTDLPAGATRVATIHVQSSGTGPLDFESRLRVAATVGGTKIKADIVIRERKNP